MRLRKIYPKRTESGQSLVELAIFLPLLLMMLSGLVEFGFLLNQYLNLMDGPREAARFAVDISPFVDDGTNDPPDNPFFYQALSDIAEESVTPYVLNALTDDIVISVFSIKDDAVFRRFPDDIAVTPIPGQWSLHNNFVSDFTNGEINSRLEIGAPNTGIVLVELFYSYHQNLALPWLTIFVPDPIQIHTYAMTPLPAAEPK